MIEVEVVHAFCCGNRHFTSRDVIFVTVDDGPYCLLAHWPTAGEYTVQMRWIKRLPACAHEKWCDSALDGSHAACRLAIARRNPIPNTPDVLPTFPADTVKERKLQVICFVACPSMRDVYHVT